MFVSIDIETTGFDPAKDEILELAAVRFDEHAIGETFEVLTKPNSPIPLEVQRLTGLRESDFEKARPLSETLGLFKKFIGRDSLIGHNISFDLGFLKPHLGKIENELFDTLVFSRVLFFSEPSYALDQLCKRFSFEKEQSHRALPDAKTTAKLFQFLLQEAKNITPQSFEILQKIFAKTDWPLKRFFKGGNKEFQTVMVRQAHHDSHFSDTFRSSVTEEILNAFRADKKIILETAEFPDLETLAKSGEPILFSYGRFREEFRNFATLHQKDHYFSPEKFRALIAEKETLDHAEAAFFTKLALFSTSIETGLRHEINLHDEEWNMWQLVSGEGAFFEKAKKQVKETSLVLCPHASLPSVLPLMPQKRSLIVSDALSLEDHLTFAFQKRFSIDHFDILLKNLEKNPASEELRSKFHILFGLLGMYYEAHVEPSESHDLLLDEKFEFSMEGQRIKETLQHIEMLRKSTNLHDILFGPFFDAFISTLQAYDPKFPRWISMIQNTPVLQSAPLELTSFFHDLTQQKKAVFMFDSALSLNKDFSFFTSLFQLDDYETQISPQKIWQKLDFVIPENLPEPNSEGYFKRSAEIIEETLEEFGGAVLVMFHTKKALQAHFENIIEKPVATKIDIFAAGKTGGLGKSVEQFLEKPDTSALFLPPTSLTTVERIIPALRAVVIQKIPFEFSFHPLTKLRQSQRSNGFLQYTLPKALLKLKQFLITYGDRGKCIFLDPRLLKKEYGALLQEFRSL